MRAFHKVVVWVLLIKIVSHNDRHPLKTRLELKSSQNSNIVFEGTFGLFRIYFWDFRVYSDERNLLVIRLSLDLVFVEDPFGSLKHANIQGITNKFTFHKGDLVACAHGLKKFNLLAVLALAISFVALEI